MRYLLHRLVLFIVFCIHVTDSKSDEGWWQTPEIRACCSEADAVWQDRPKMKREEHRRRSSLNYEPREFDQNFVDAPKRINCSLS